MRIRKKKSGGLPCPVITFGSSAGRLMLARVAATFTAFR